MPSAELPDLQEAGAGHRQTHCPVLGRRLIPVRPACLSSLASCTPALTDSGLQLRGPGFTVRFRIPTPSSRLLPLPGMPLLPFLCLLRFLSRQLKCYHLRRTAKGRPPLWAPGPSASSPLHALFGICPFARASSLPDWEPIELWVPRPSPGTNPEEVRP